MKDLENIGSLMTDLDKIASQIDDAITIHAALTILISRCKSIINKTLPSDGEYAYSFDEPVLWNIDVVSDENNPGKHKIKDQRVASFSYSDNVLTLNFTDGESSILPIVTNDDIVKALGLAVHYACDKELKEDRAKEGQLAAKVVVFDNEDIVITDPCYIFKGDDWRGCDYGRTADVYGIDKYICRNTIYGDWSCTTFNSDTKEAIGRFCADAGLVCVASLKEILAYRPDFEEWAKEHDWCVTIIRNFTGQVKFDVVHYTFEYSEDYARTTYNPDTQQYEPLKDDEGNILYFWKKGDIGEGDKCQVVGTGSINFITEQTGL